ncbi:hypothetical protein INR49_011951 [Caranx melampygus]|nr:hypothetical protein INR49_011951 [Caranx melampygus]
MVTCLPVCSHLKADPTPGGLILSSGVVTENIKGDSGLVLMRRWIWLRPLWQSARGHMLCTVLKLLFWSLQSRKTDKTGTLLTADGDRWC